MSRFSVINEDSVTKYLPAYWDYASFFQHLPFPESVSSACDESVCSKVPDLSWDNFGFSVVASWKASKLLHIMIDIGGSSSTMNVWRVWCSSVMRTTYWVHMRLLVRTWRRRIGGTWRSKSVAILPWRPRQLPNAISIPRFNRSFTFQNECLGFGNADGWKWKAYKLGMRVEKMSQMVRWI